MVYDGPILDNHFHLNRKGLFLEAARSFQRVGDRFGSRSLPDFAAPPKRWRAIVWPTPTR